MQGFIFCKRCNAEIAADSVYCNYCGKKQDTERKAKKANGSGTVYKSGNAYAAEFTYGYSVVDGKNKRIMKRKKGFKTKKAALEWIEEIKNQTPSTQPSATFEELYEKWLKTHRERVSKGTINCYTAAYNHLDAVKFQKFSKIKTEQMQFCIDNCSKGHRTKENMKALCTSLFDYAMQLDIVSKNYAKYIRLPKKEETERIAFSNEQLETLWEHPENRVAKLFLVLCYTGLRVGELVEAKTENYNKNNQYFVAGSKTAAGKNRIITVSPKIQPFLDDLCGEQYLFTLNGKKIRIKVFRQEFYTTLENLGIIKKGDRTLTPHCCRHTFATLMKNVDAPATDKQKLIGHASFEMTAHYTHTDIESLREITDKI